MRDLVDEYGNYGDPNREDIGAATMTSPAPITVGQLMKAAKTLCKYYQERDTSDYRKAVKMYSDMLEQFAAQQRADATQQLQRESEQLKREIECEKILHNGTLKLLDYAESELAAAKQAHADDHGVWIEKKNALKSQLEAAKQQLAEAYEQCAKLVEQNQENDGGNGKYLAPRIEGNLTGLHFAKAIRAIDAARTAQAGEKQG